MAKDEQDQLDDFESYCATLSDRQVHGVIEKESKAAEGGDAFRRGCLRIAKAEARKRGLDVDA